MTGFTVVNRNTGVFLGRGVVRDFPMLFSKAEHAADLIKESAQVPADWRIAEVDFTISDK